MCRTHPTQIFGEYTPQLNPVSCSRIGRVQLRAIFFLVNKTGKLFEVEERRLFPQARNQHKEGNQIVLFFCFHQNLADIVAKQQKLKYYTQLKSGRYTPLCKTPETLETELQKQRARLQSLMTIVDRLNQEFPQAQPALRKITLSLGYRGIPEEATA